MGASRTLGAPLIPPGGLQPRTQLRLRRSAPALGGLSPAAQSSIRPPAASVARVHAFLRVAPLLFRSPFAALRASAACSSPTALARRRPRRPQPRPSRRPRKCTRSSLQLSRSTLLSRRPLCTRRSLARARRAPTRSLRPLHPTSVHAHQRPTHCRRTRTSCRARTMSLSCRCSRDASDVRTPAAGACLDVAELDLQATAPSSLATNIERPGAHTSPAWPSFSEANTSSSRRSPTRPRSSPRRSETSSSSPRVRSALLSTSLTRRRRERRLRLGFRRDEQR